MTNLLEVIQEAGKRKTALGHFNVSESTALKAIADAARELGVAVIIGVSESERHFLGIKQIVALVRSLREEFNLPIFLNADHTRSLQSCVEAAAAGFDAVIFDGSTLPLSENIAQTKTAAAAVKKINPGILVEGELGYIGSGSQIREGLPQGAVIKPHELTKPDEAARFVKETRVDFLAPAVGNLHGMFAEAPEPALDIKRIKAIAEAVKIPLVLHGASGNTDAELAAAVAAGVRIVHVSTELRLAWRQGLEEAFAAEPREVAPYKLLSRSEERIKKVVTAKLKIFNRLA